MLYIFQSHRTASFVISVFHGSVIFLLQGRKTIMTEHKFYHDMTCLNAGVSWINYKLRYSLERRQLKKKKASHSLDLHFYACWMQLYLNVYRLSEGEKKTKKPRCDFVQAHQALKLALWLALWYSDKKWFYTTLHNHDLSHRLHIRLAMIKKKQIHQAQSDKIKSVQQNRCRIHVKPG